MSSKNKKSHSEKASHISGNGTLWPWRSWTLGQSLEFTGCTCIQFFNSPPFLNSLPSPNTLNEAAPGHLTLTVQCLCNLQEAMCLSPSA